MPLLGRCDAKKARGHTHHPTHPAVHAARSAASPFAGAHHTHARSRHEQGQQRRWKMPMMSKSSTRRTIRGSVAPSNRHRRNSERRCLVPFVRLPPSLPPQQHITICSRTKCVNQVPGGFGGGPTPRPRITLTLCARRAMALGTCRGSGCSHSAAFYNLISDFDFASHGCRLQTKLQIRTTLLQY